MGLDNIKNGIKAVKKHAENMPSRAGVYKMIGEGDVLLYVGKAKNLPKRVISYSKVENLPNRLRRMVARIQRIEYITTKTEAEALILEASLIKSQKPLYNISLKDDKSFPYIIIEKKHDFPRIAKYRGKPRKDMSYYGPFASAGAVNTTITQVQKIFLIRPCTDQFFASRTRPCLQYQIKRCSAPCVDKIAKSDYKKLVDQTEKFLAGDSSEIQKALSYDMQVASENMEYERAATIRDRIKVISQLQAKNIFSNQKVKDTDVIAVYRNDKGNCALVVFLIRTGQNYGNRAYFFDDLDEDFLPEAMENFIGQFYQHNMPPKQIIVDRDLPNSKDISSALSDFVKYNVVIKKPKIGILTDLIEFAQDNAKNALAETQRKRIEYINNFHGIAKLFGITRPMRRIEVYDNSHNFGSYAVGAMIVITLDGLQKSEYRSYSIKMAAKQDDYDMLREVLRRRLAKLDDRNYPTLMLIDGGRGHLSVAQEIFKAFSIKDIKLVSIAKGVNRNAGREHFYTDDGNAFQLPKGDRNLHYLQMIRDEVHRFAISTHRKKRGKDIKKSSLDDLAGIGVVRKKALLNHFGSTEAIRSSSVDDLIKVDGISKKLAKAILERLKMRT